MFKKRTNDKKLKLQEDIETIQINQQATGNLIVPKNIHSKQINKFTSKLQQEPDKKVSKNAIKYGLIDHEEIEGTKTTPTPNNSLMSLYIKNKMKEISAKQSKQNNNTTATEIIKMQKQYLESAQSKLAEYDAKQIQKRFQKLSAQAIKSETEFRNQYLKSLLESEHQRMEYASKKQLKIMRQERQREEKELISKYRSEGRRHYVSELKNTSLFQR